MGEFCPINTVPPVAEVATFRFPDVIFWNKLVKPVGAPVVIVLVATEVRVDAPALKVPAIDINDAVIADPIKLIVELVVVPIFTVFDTDPCVAILTVPPKNPLVAILTAAVVLPTPISQVEPKILVVELSPPIFIFLVPVPVAKLTVPVLDASSYKDTAVPTAVPVIVFVITEVSVDAPALIVPKAFVPVQVLLLPKRDTDAEST